MTHSGQIGLLIPSNGNTLLGTLFLARGENPKPTVLLLHGIPGIEKNYDVALSLRKRGWNAVIFHYRGCWGSSGKYNVSTIPQDVICVVDELSSGRYSRINRDRIFVIGHSLGGWAAVLAAADDPRIRAVAVIGALSEPRDFPLDQIEVASEYSPWLSGISPGELAAQWAALGPDQNPLNQVVKIAPRPFLIIHSLNDEDVPVAHSRKLAKQAGTNSRFIEHPEANHSFTWHRDWLFERLFEWLTTEVQA